MTQATIVADITKATDEGLIYAWASIVEEGGQQVVDVQGDIIPVAELQKAAHSFMSAGREVGEMHSVITGIGKFVESMVFTKDLQDTLGIDLGKVGWLVAMKVDPASPQFAKVKSGEYKALSIGGRGKRASV